LTIHSGKTTGPILIKLDILIIIVVRTYPRVAHDVAHGEAAAYAAKRGEAAALRHVAAKPRMAKPHII